VSIDRWSVYGAAAAAAVADKDECAGGLGPCGTAQTAVSCNNTVGSYTCDCLAGYQFANGACQGTSPLHTASRCCNKPVSLVIIHTELCHVATATLNVITVSNCYFLVQ